MQERADWSTSERWEISYKKLIILQRMESEKNLWEVTVMFAMSTWIKKEIKWQKKVGGEF